MTGGDNRGYSGLYLAPGVGARFFPKLSSHGLLVDFEYKFLARANNRWCLFGSTDCRSARTELGVAHLGYAYRHIIAGPLSPQKRFWGITSHVDLSVGWAYNEPTGGVPTPKHSPAVGLRAGVDMDLHFKVCFIGWSLSYEAIKQTHSAVSETYAWWHFFVWNVIPVLRIGVDLGKANWQPR